MNHEYEILSYIEKNTEISQRQIAGGTGLSVGTVNLLLKKMVHKGLLKLERVNGRTLRYILTPGGMAEKTRLAYQYLKASYGQIIKISRAVEQVIAEYQAAHGPAGEIILCGSPGDVPAILKIVFHNLGMKYRIVEEIGDFPGDVLKNVLVITWGDAWVKQLDSEYNVINILEIL
ncbi:winged helix-turn-helix transcriptional regulator [Desulfoscipio sp. XC116]|uniref:winged helix-turn-helix transcriptional regulator n=1 Tax=Desulfoscipio sp. XC116 TaxID=3144975 RepID=UPI00325ADBD2